MKSLQNKVAIITGGGRGIGREIALAFSREGAQVVIGSRTSKELDLTLSQIKSEGGVGIGIPTDVTKTEDVDYLVNTSVKTFKGIDILINAAGIQGPIGLLHENSIDAWIKTIHINLIGTFVSIRAVLPYLIKEKKGKIINFSGGGATAPRPNFTAYSASKAAVVRLTETVAEEVQTFNIQVNAVAPGIVGTKMLENILSFPEKAGKREVEAARLALDKKETPQKAVNLALFLASAKSDGITGKLLSAVYDDWERWDPNCIKNIQKSDLYTLRRLDSYTLEKIEPYLGLIEER